MGLRPPGPGLLRKMISIFQSGFLIRERHSTAAMCKGDHILASDNRIPFRARHLNASCNRYSPGTKVLIRARICTRFETRS